MYVRVLEIQDRTYVNHHHLNRKESKEKKNSFDLHVHMYVLRFRIIGPADAERRHACMHALLVARCALLSLSPLTTYVIPIKAADVSGAATSTTLFTTKNEQP